MTHGSLDGRPEARSLLPLTVAERAGCVASLPAVWPFR